jgi:acylphosphatase
MSRESDVTVHVIVYGKVQGVFFRAHTKRFADELGIRGSVKNLVDGTVEIYAQGEKSAVEALFSRLLAKEGPGEVERVEKKFLQKSLDFSQFNIIY